MTTGPLILIIDDELQIRRFLRISLESIGYRVHEAVTGAEGLIEAASQRPDLVILDLGLPDEDGTNVLKRLREWSHVPVVVLSVRNADTDIIALLDAGADDYLTKPFSVGELQARVRLALRHTQTTPEAAVFQNGSLTVDLAKRLVTLNDEIVKLTTTEYAMLRLFVQHPGRVLTHAQILREVWGPGYAEETHYLRVYVASLRKKIEADPADPKLIVTEPGVGYRLMVTR